MRFIFFLLVVLTPGLTGFISPEPFAEEGIRVNITRLKNTKGHVLVSLFKDGTGYPDHPEKAIRKVQLDINGTTASVLFTGMQAGRYAVSILHDENDDRKMNTNSLGIPKEGYGFSNNVIGAFGPPGWNRASFEHKTGLLTVMEVRTRY